MARISWTLIALALCVSTTGCQTEPTRAPLLGERDQEQSQAFLVLEEDLQRLDRPRHEVPPHRQPSLVGDYLYYPLQWRNAHEVGEELYFTLYPKYGPLLQIVPDVENNALLIYLPPKAVQWQEAPWGGHQSGY